MRRRFNVLHVVADQHQAACMGCEGHPQAVTPHLDRLAGEGVRFAQAYTQNPLCTPSRVSFLSGQYPHNHGYYGLSGPTPRSLPSVLGHFRSHGYRTGAVGKLHLPDEPTDWVLDHVDRHVEVMARDPDNPYHRFAKAHGFFERMDHGGIPELPGRQQHEARPSPLPFEHTVEGFTVAEAQRFIDEADGRPWFAHVSLFRPHECFTPPQRFWDQYPDDLAPPPGLMADESHRPPHFREMVERYRRMTGLLQPDDFQSLARRVWRGYLAAVTMCDHALGQLLEHLRHRGEAGHTIVVYHADHGAYTGLHGVPSKAPGICSEAVCRVPMIWRVPGVTPAGAVSHHFAELVDLPTTLTALCGLPSMETADGEDLSPLLRGGDHPVKACAVTENVWSKGFRWDDWRLVHYQPELFGGKDVGELYNLRDDPEERRNLYHDPSHQRVVEEGRRLLLQWLIRTTRAVSRWPAEKANVLEPFNYPLAADGREERSAARRPPTQAQINYL